MNMRPVLTVGELPLGPTDSASPREHDWNEKGKTESVTKGWPVLDHLGAPGLAIMRITKSKTREAQTIISEHARVLDTIRGPWCLGQPWWWLGFAAIAAEDDEGRNLSVVIYRIYCSRSF
jgi:hypothetical protein